MQERLNKLIAQAGLASRRGAEELITDGKVSVNGKIITELGTKADAEKDHIKVNGKLINLKLAKRENAYVLLNKPKGYLSSAADPEGRRLVTDLVPSKGFGKLHPVGTARLQHRRLDNSDQRRRFHQSRRVVKTPFRKFTKSKYQRHCRTPSCGQ